VYVERDIRDRFYKMAEEYGIMAVVGPRQSGKTTFLKQQMKERNAEYVLFDDLVARSLFNDEFKQFELEYIEGKELTILDEVQYGVDPGSKLKYLVDNGNKLWVTSSSEILLGRDVLSYLVGRVKVLRLHTFSFPEFLRAKGHRVLPSVSRGALVAEHIEYGGYPRVVLSSDKEFKMEYLRDLSETLLLKDVARTFGLRKMTALEKLSRYLSLSPGALLNRDTTSSSLEINRQTLVEYLDAMEKSYIILRIKPFFTNKKKEMVKQERIYFMDTGLLNAVANDFRPVPSGNLFENYVLTELLKMGYSPKYWRTRAKAEVDFVIDEDEVIPIEVKSLIDKRKVERSLRSFIDTYGPTRAYMVGIRGQSGEVEVNGCRVVYTDLPGLWEHLKGTDFSIRGW
jgi:predicted AAA+ superfamily ATPase